MNGSLGKRASAFEGLILRHVFALLEVLEHSSIRTESRIRKVFSQHAQGFDSTLSFLIRISVVQKRGGILSLRVAPPSAGGPARQEWLLSRLLQTRNRYRSELLRYLSKYKVLDGELIYNAPVPRRSRESHVRNFLMQMGIVRHDVETGRCVLSRDYMSLCVSVRGRGRQVLPDLLAKSTAARDEMGLSAEIAVIEFEKKRLGPRLANEVDHVALRNAAAGYDIRSITVADDRPMMPRYIEVKAVSPASMRFHWTQNEMNVAQVLQESYYLYLLPVDSGGSFDLGRLMMIPNPHIAVLGSETEWIIEPDVICCSLQRERSAPRQPAGGTNHA